MIPDVKVFGSRQGRIRFVRQTEIAECGLACLTMVVTSYGMKTDLGSLRRRFQPSIRGAALKHLIALSVKLGLSVRALKLPLEKLRDLHTPAILHWDMSHYVVLERVKGQKALIHNPATGSSWVSLSEVSYHFTGVALELKKAQTFEIHERTPRVRINQLWDNIAGLKRAALQTILLSIVLQLFLLITPYYLQFLVDSVLPTQDVSLLIILAVSFCVLAFLNAAVTLIRRFVLLFAGASVGHGISVNVASRLLLLPLPWFSRRHVGDVLSRFQSVSPIRQFMTEGAIGILLDGFLTITIMIVMAYYSLSLTGIALCAVFCYITLKFYLFPKQRNAQEELITANGIEQSTMIESIRGIITLRMYNKELSRHMAWQTKLVDVTNASARLERVNSWQQTGSALIFGIDTTVSLAVAVNLIIAGSFTLGMTFAYVAYKTQFIQRAIALIDQVVTARMLHLHLDRVSDIALTRADPSADFEVKPDCKIEGSVELRDISFRYSESDPLVLNSLSLFVEAGDHIAITGPSGEGKSTLVKILLGIVNPDEGLVLVDGKEISKLGYNNFRTQVAAVLQDDSIFGGTIADNITIFEDEPDQSLIRVAATLAALDADIQAMPMGYETLVGDMGSSLSGGQKQRLLLARAFYRKPRILVMDEGTSALDAEREAAVNRSIRQIGATLIVIAHRKETIEAARIVYRLAGGVLTKVESSPNDPVSAAGELERGSN